MERIADIREILRPRRAIAPQFLHCWSALTQTERGVEIFLGDRQPGAGVGESGAGQRCAGRAELCRARASRLAVCRLLLRPLLSDAEQHPTGTLTSRCRLEPSRELSHIIYGALTDRTSRSRCFSGPDVKHFVDAQRLPMKPEALSRRGFPMGLPWPVRSARQPRVLRTARSHRSPPRRSTTTARKEATQ